MIKKIQDLFHEKIDKHKFFLGFRIILFFFLSILVFNSFKLTLSRYVSETEVNITPKLAFFITDVGTYENKIELESIIPRTSAYLYSFTVSNFLDEKKANVNIIYDVQFVTTTNLPLNFKIYKNVASAVGPGIVNSDTFMTDTDGMYFRRMEISSSGSFSFEDFETDTYLIWVEFPEMYKAYPDSYEGLIELIEIKIEAKQVI